MNRLLTLLMLIFLTSLACVLPSQLPTPTPNAPKPVVRNTPTNALVTAEVTAIEALCVRNEPMGLRIGYLYHADAVTLTGKCQTGWAQIIWKSGRAWVNADYLSDNMCKE